MQRDAAETGLRDAECAASGRLFAPCHAQRRGSAKPAESSSRTAAGVTACLTVPLRDLSEQLRTNGSTVSAAMRLQFAGHRTVTGAASAPCRDVIHPAATLHSGRRGSRNHGSKLQWEMVCTTSTSCGARAYRPSSNRVTACLNGLSRVRHQIPSSLLPMCGN